MKNNQIGQVLPDMEMVTKFTERMTVEEMLAQLKVLTANVAGDVTAEESAELSVKVLKAIRDCVHILGITLYTIAERTSSKARKVIKPIYQFVQSFDTELKEAIADPDNYDFKPIDMPDLPDIDDLDEQDASAVKDFMDAIIQALPAIVDLLNDLFDTDYAYKREVKIVINTIDEFCKKWVEKA